MKELISIKYNLDVREKKEDKNATMIYYLCSPIIKDTISFKIFQITMNYVK